MITLLEKLESYPNKLPMFTIEVFAKQPLDTEEIKKVADYELSLGLHDEICSHPEVVAIKADLLVGASMDPSYEAHGRRSFKI